MANESAFSLREMIRNRKTKKRLFEVFIVSVYVLSLFIYQEYWTTLIDFLWVNPIASRFDSSNTFWLILYGLVLAIVLVYYIIAFANERRYSYFRIILLLFVLSLFLFCTKSLDWTFDGYFALIVILELTLGELCVFCNIFLMPENDTAEYNGLAFEHPIVRSKQEILSSKETYGRTDYVISTYSLLKNTFDSKAAFAIGISGKWGSGKTSFTNDLKTLLKDDVDIVMEFKPWFCKSPNEIIEDFFNEYRYNIATFIPGLNAKLKFYMDALQNVEIHNSNLKLSFKNFMPQRSSGRIYGDIIETLIKASVKVVVVIDDLDRLDKDEILEVLRLIRNTANFPYTQFIVTYDKDYVLKTLPQNSKVNYNDFLMKIFNLEIALPSYEKNILCVELEKRMISILQRIRISYSERDVHDMVFVRITNFSDDFEIFEDNKRQPTHYNNLDLKIPQILGTMRDIIRFSNSFELNLNSFVKDEIKEIEYKDFFYLELLHYKCSDVYSDLKEDPLKYLYFTGEGRYQIENPQRSLENSHTSKDNKIDSLVNEMKGVNQEMIKFLFEKLFSKERQFIEKSIASLSNYFTYFACRLDVRNLSQANVISLLSKTSDDALKEVVRWYEDLEIYEGQLEGKLTMCFQSIIPKEKNLYAEIAYDKVYKLILYLYHHVNIEEQKNEIFSSITNHISFVTNFYSGYVNMTEAQYLDFLNFCLTFFDVIDEKDTDVNSRFIEFVFEDEARFSDSVYEILSSDIASYKLANRIYKYIYELSTDLKKQDLDALKIILNRIVKIQFDRLKNRISNQHLIDVLVLDMYDNSVSSARKTNNNNLIREIKKYFKEIVYKYPASFLNSNIRIEKENIEIIIPLKNILSAEVDYIDFEKKLKSSLVHQEGERILNLWELLKANDYQAISSYRLEGYDLTNTDFNEDSVKQVALSKLDKEIKGWIIQFDKSNIGSFDRRGLVVRLKEYKEEIEQLEIRLVTKQLLDIQKFLSDKIDHLG